MFARTVAHRGFLCKRKVWSGRQRTCAVLVAGRETNRVSQIRRFRGHERLGDTWPVEE